MLIIHELHEARDRLLFLKKQLNEAAAKELPAYRPVIEEQVRVLEDALQQAKIPDSYRVAVVGRFKVGKSSFVNKLAEERLAGVDTNPETAAISIFRYDTVARAEIELISEEEWKQLAEDYAENPKSAEVKRYDRFISFNDRSQRKDKSGKLVERDPADLDALVKEWVVSGGKVHTIPADAWDTKASKKAFLQKIRRFTTSREPLHYLVNKLTIYAPIPILRDQIELVDTPGLDDTERFRVLLTEDLVKDVDAILFLTVSGASYGQSDKEFIVRQLRRRQIKHLQLIVTKIDETYENAKRDARENDDDPPTFEEFCKNERQRIRGEVSSTLDELLESNQLSDEEGYYFIEQLQDVPIHLISTTYHDEGETAKGGIDGVRENLYRILSTSHRFEQSRTVLRDRLDGVLSSLRQRYIERLDSLESDFDPQKVRQQIEAIRAALETNLTAFGGKSGEAVGLLSKEQEAFFKTLPVNLDLLSMQAKEVLSDLEKGDLLLHWKSRRSGYWGYMTDLQSKVADRIFPKVESLLNQLYAQLEGFMNETGGRLEALQAEMKAVEERHNLSGLEPIDLSATLKPLFEGLRKQFHGIIEAERDGIVNSLDDFVTEEVQNRLSDARKEVADVWGTGTTIRQGQSVTEFYGKIRRLLSDALRDHLSRRIKEFADAAKASAESVTPRIRTASEETIQRRLVAIESSLQVSSEGQKEQVEKYLREMIEFVSNFPISPDALTPVQPPTTPQGSPAKTSPGRVDTPSRPKERHFEIPEGAIGYTYERIFRPYIDTATEIVIEDPFIRKPFQVENLLRFCALAVRVAEVTKINLFTGQDFGEDLDEINSRLETLRRDLASREIQFQWTRSPDLHDREIRFDNGWIVKIGRGLDIYHKPDSWTSVAAADFSLRPCRQTKVDIFSHASQGMESEDEADSEGASPMMKT